MHNISYIRILKTYLRHFWVQAKQNLVFKTGILFSLKMAGTLVPKPVGDKPLIFVYN
jgi:hypothetical protein